jgi:hypothetical protein
MQSSTRLLTAEEAAVRASLATRQDSPSQAAGGCYAFADGGPREAEAIQSDGANRSAM